MANSARSLPNPVAPLTRLLASTLTVSDIVSTRLWSVPTGMAVREALEAMSNRSFDIAGVTPNPPNRFVQRSVLERANDNGAAFESIDGYAESIPASACIEKSLPVGSLLKLFEDHERLFVLDGNVVQWVLTHADLVAPAVSVAVLSYLAVIESGLKQLSGNLSDEDIQGLLSADRCAYVNSDFDSRLKSNVETSFRDCLSLHDWFKVIGKTPKILERLGYSSRKAFDNDVGAFQSVRNDLAHGRDLLAGPNASVPEVLDRVERIRKFSTEVWRAIDHSRSLWDEYAASIISLSGKEQVALSGSRAIAEWPFSDRTFVLSAWNPGGIWVSAEQNRAATEMLRASLERREARVQGIERSSVDGHFSEQGFLIEGLNALQVAELGCLFGQVACLELDEEFLKVYDCVSMDVVRKEERRKL